MVEIDKSMSTKLTESQILANASFFDAKLLHDKKVQVYAKASADDDFAGAMIDSEVEITGTCVDGKYSGVVTVTIEPIPERMTAFPDAVVRIDGQDFDLGKIWDGTDPRALSFQMDRDHFIRIVWDPTAGKVVESLRLLARL